MKIVHACGRSPSRYKEDKVKKIFVLIVVAMILATASFGGYALAAGGFVGSQSETFGFQVTDEEPISVSLESVTQDGVERNTLRLWPGEKVRLEYWVHNSAPIPQRILLTAVLREVERPAGDYTGVPATIFFGGPFSDDIRPAWNRSGGEQNLAISLRGGESVMVDLVIWVNYDAPLGAGPWEVILLAQRISPPAGCDPFGCG